ncbi:Trypsin domain containing protein, partial [Asbolus verrucosus]
KPPFFLGKNFGLRIIGGNIASDGQFPWDVAIYVYKSDGMFFCGGALIYLKWVLTAGRCVDGADSFTLSLGSNSLVNVDSHRIIVEAAYSVVHPDYNSITQENDIGLIRIDTPIETSAYIQTIPLAKDALESDLPVTISGWGSTNAGGFSYDLSYLDLTTISNIECTSKTGESISDQLVCAVGSNSQGTCTGDGGSPLVARDNAGTTIHVGVASWASASGCQTRQPSRYIRTAKFNDWIQSVIKE